MSLWGLKYLPHTAEMVTTQPPTYRASVTWVGPKVTTGGVPCEGPPFSPHPRAARGQGLPCPGRDHGSHNRLNEPGCCPHPRETMCPAAPLTQGRALVCGQLDGPWGHGVNPLRPEEDSQAWQCRPGMPSGAPLRAQPSPQSAMAAALPLGSAVHPGSAVMLVTIASTPTSWVQGSALNPSLFRFI